MKKVVCQTKAVIRDCSDEEIRVRVGVRVGVFLDKIGRFLFFVQLVH